MLPACQVLRRYNSRRRIAEGRRPKSERRRAKTDDFEFTDMNDTRRRPADLGAPPATPRPRTSVFGLLPSIFGILTSDFGLRTSPFRLRTPLLPCLLATTLFLAARPAFTDDQQFLAGLRQRQLFDLAALYCESRLADTDLTARQQSELVVELSRTHAKHALNSPPGERGRAVGRRWAGCR